MLCAAMRNGANGTHQELPGGGRQRGMHRRAAISASVGWGGVDECGAGAGQKPARDVPDPGTARAAAARKASFSMLSH